jgi:hypothetical protein
MTHPLTFPFDRHGFRHVLLERTGNVCLVARHNLQSGSVHYEVVVLQHWPPRTLPTGRVIPARERYPSTDAWGRSGWTFTKLEEARAKCAALATRIPVFGPTVRASSPAEESVAT